MDTRTGHLVAAETLDAMPETQQRRYKPVPKKLHGAARKLLNGRADANVDLGGGTLLAQWAARDRAAKLRQRKAAKRAKQLQRRRAR